MQARQFRLSTLLTLLLCTVAAHAQSAREVTLRDLLDNVYGAVDASTLRSAEDCVTMTEEICGISPVNDEDGLWLDSADGYALTYFGMSPTMSAVAEFEGNSLCNHSYFFIFPYDCGGRCAANASQCQFCSAMLQEMKDSGLDVRSTIDPEALFGVCCHRNGTRVEMRLMEENDVLTTAQTAQSDALPSELTDAADAASGRFILILSASSI